MRTDKVVKNITYDYLGNILNALISFVLKTVFIYSLGKEYLGLNGLFTNVLAMLSLTELGMSTAVTYELYKPLTQNDHQKVRSIMSFYKKAYQIVGLAILIIGLLIVPLLQYIVNFDQQVSINYYVIYLLFLASTILSYWFNAYKATLLIADQKKYETKKIEYVMTLAQTVIQFIVLLWMKDYYLYLIIAMVRAVVQNYLVARVTDRKYPFLNESKAQPLSKHEKQSIFKNIYALALYKVSGVVVNSTDNIIISAFINIGVLGCYSLYNYLIITVKSFVAVIFDSFVVAVGEINATESLKGKKTIFDIIFFLSFVVYGLSAICLWQLSSVFIELWAGKEFVLDESTILLMVISFLILGFENATYIFRTACGLFNQAKFRPLAGAVINLAFSLLLVNFLGIDGVFWGTIISRVTTYLIIDPAVVYKHIFKLPVWGYYKQYGVYCGIVVGTGVLCHIINSCLFTGGWLALVARAVVCVVIFGGMVVLFYRKDFRFRYLLEKLTETMKRIRRIKQ